MPKADELQKLAVKIRGHYETTERLVTLAVETNNQAVAEAILCGQALNEAKAIVGHGGWIKWVARHCKGVTDRTARKYMALANRNHGSVLEDGVSLRQAYILTGIIKDIEPAPAPSPTTTPQPKRPKVELNPASIPSLQTVKTDPIPVISSTVQDLLTLLSTVPQGDQEAARSALSPLTPWLLRPLATKKTRAPKATPARIAGRLRKAWRKRYGIHGKK